MPLGVTGQHGFVKPAPGARVNQAHRLARGLVGIWPFAEGGGTPGIEALTGYRGVPSAVIPWSTRKEGWAPLFDHGAVKTIVTRLNRPIANKPFTVVCDCRIDYRSGSAPVAIGSVATDNQLFHIVETGGGIRFSLYTNDLNFTYSGKADGDRFNVICRLDSALLQTLWLDGVQVASQTSSSYFIGTPTVTFGDSPGLGNSFGGSINMVAVYDRVLTPDECRLIYRQPFCMFSPPAWQSWPMDAGGGAPATTGAAQIFGFSRMADTGVKGAVHVVSFLSTDRMADAATKTATNTAALLAPARLAPAAQKGGVSAAVLKTTGRLSTAALKGGLSTIVQRVGGLLAAAGTHAGTTTSAALAEGRAAAVGAHAGTAIADEHAGGLLANLASSARSAAGLLQALAIQASGSSAQSQRAADFLTQARLAAQGVKASSATANEQATGRLEALVSSARTATALLNALARQAAASTSASERASAFMASARIASDAVKASTATANERAGGMVANLALTARSAVAVLKAMAGQVATSVPTYSQPVAFIAQARLAASGIKGGLSASVQIASARMASAWIKGTTGEARLSSMPRGSSAAQHAATALAAFRTQPGLSVVGVVGRSGAAEFYARGNGVISNIPLPPIHGRASATVEQEPRPSAEVTRT